VIIKGEIAVISDITGRVWKLGDNIDTDVIISGKYLNLPMDEIKKHVLEAINPAFYQDVKRGELIVAGRYFGCGSSRETAPAALKALGIAAVIAESFSRIFYRNAIAIGLPTITCPNAHAAFNQGDEAKIHFKNTYVANLTTGKSLDFQPFPNEMLKVLESGGIERMLRQMTSRRRNG
jgi:3-isopropylmalate dehydratase small subunit